MKVEVVFVVLFPWFHIRISLEEVSDKCLSLLECLHISIGHVLFSWHILFSNFFVRNVDRNLVAKDAKVGWDVGMSVSITILSVVCDKVLQFLQTNPNSTISVLINKSELLVAVLVDVHGLSCRVADSFLFQNLSPVLHWIEVCILWNLCLRII